MYIHTQIMETLLRIFSFRSATVHEEAMLAIGAFTYALGKQFTKYLQAFAPYIKTGLQNYQEWQVCARGGGGGGVCCVCCVWGGACPCIIHQDRGCVTCLVVEGGSRTAK